MSKALYHHIQSVVAAFLQQQQCILCHQSSDKLICSYCSGDLNLFDLEGCHYNLLNRQNVRSHLEPPRYHKLLALAPYQWPISTLLSQLKFGGKLIHSKALADLFFCHCLNENHALPIENDTILIPVPLHRSRLMSRKYNQSLEIVRQLNIDKRCWDKEVCYREKRTDPQTELSATQRKNNVKNAFSLTGQINENHVIIFDDVVTTGATVNSLCNTLLSSNPNLKIEVWCIGLTLKH
jgi:ComF family protein